MDAQVALDKRDNLRFGLIASTVRNANRSKSTDKIWQPGDFFEHGNAPVEQAGLTAKRAGDRMKIFGAAVKGYEKRKDDAKSSARRRRPG